jgi:hypothetical protein
MSSDTSNPTDEEVVETTSSIPLAQLQLVPPSASASIPSKPIKALMENDGLQLEIALVLDAAQADIASNYPPQRHRVTTPVGYLTVVSMRLLTSMVTVAAFNLRDAASRKRHLAAERRAGRRWMPDFGLPKPDPRNGPGCIVHLESRDQLDYWVRWERQRLSDPALRKWIAEDTILDSTLIQPVKFESPDGEAWMLVAMDGSRRITNALDAMRPAIQLDPSLALSHCDDGDLRPMTSEDVKRARRANLYPGTDNPSPLFPDSKRDEDVALWVDTATREVADFHRARTLPANVIIGFEPFLDELGQPVGTITDAVDSLLRQKHVMNARPKEWSRGDNSVLIGTRALAKLEDTMEKHPVTRRQEPVLDDLAADVLSGEMSIEAALRPDGSPRFRDPLHALAMLAATLGAPRSGSPAAKSVLSTLNEWRQPASPRSRALIAADMSVHVVGVPESAISQVVAAVGGLFIGREFRDADIKLTDNRTWHHLLDYSLEEVAVNAAEELRQGKRGAWSVLLSLYGGLAMIVNPDATSDGLAWTRLTQTGLGRGDNNATPDAVVRAMVETIEGQELLADAAKQVGRRLALGANAPMVALTIKLPGEAAEPMTETRVRQLWDPDPKTSGTTRTPAASADKMTMFQLKCQALVRQTELLLQQIEEVEGMRDETDGSILLTRGLDPLFSTALNRAGMKTVGIAAMGAQVWSSRSSSAPTLSSVEDESSTNEMGGD